MIKTNIQISPTCNKGLFLTHVHVGCELAVTLSHALSLLPNPDRKRGPDLGNVYRKRTTMVAPRHSPETFCSEMGCVHSAHIPSAKASHRADTDIAWVGRLFLPEGQAPGRGLCKHHMFYTNNTVYHTIDVL